MSFPALSFATLAMAALTPAAPAPHPLTLLVARTAAGVTLEVVGDSASAYTARYELEASSGATRNRSVQGGTVRLVPHQRVSLMTLGLGGDASAGWTARLRVTASDGARYEQVEHD